MAVAILKEDDLIDREFDGFVRKLITYMMEDPRTISPQPGSAFPGQRRLSGLATIPRTLPNSSFIWSRARMCRHTSLDEIESAVL